MYIFLSIQLFCISGSDAKYLIRKISSPATIILSETPVIICRANWCLTVNFACR